MGSGLPFCSGDRRPEIGEKVNALWKKSGEDSDTEKNHQTLQQYG